MGPETEECDGLSEFCLGSIASFERRRHVCFTANYGRITATQRTDALGQNRTHALQQNSGGHAARSTRMSISLRSSAKSIGFVRSASAPFSKALRFVSASP
jgi:hypothetical protein